MTDTSKITDAVVKSPGVSRPFPFGCTVALLDLVGIYVVVTHLGEIAGRMAGLIRLVP